MMDGPINNKVTDSKGEVNAAFEKDTEVPQGLEEVQIEDEKKGEENPEKEGELNPVISDTSDASNYTRDEEKREQWTNPIEFLLSCIAMSVGIGNFYRFPFVAYSNGGGAFLIPYLIVLFFIGKPVYYLELCIGQFCAYGQVKCWKMAPFFKGVGYGSTLASFCVVSYYVSVMALTVFYFFASFQKHVPWSKEACDDSWAGDGVCKLNQTEFDKLNITYPQLYFENEVLKQKISIEDGIGYPEWRLTLCYLFSWICVFLSIVKGVQSSGKVAYFTAIYPYVILILLLITGSLKPGATDGMRYFITPQWEKIYDPQVWYAAVSQCFFSLSTGFGPIIMYASYNPFRHNVYRDALIVSLMDTFTSLLAGFTVFSILGYIAHETGEDVSVVAKSGPGLVFVSYADIIAKFDYVSQLISVLFFLMLFSLGVGSAVSWQMAVITVISDQFPSWRKSYITAGVCIICFLIGLIYCTPGGQFMLTLVDNFGGNFVIYVLATLEVIGICWVYGLTNICDDIEFMLKRKVGWYWKFCWGFFVPVVLTGILIYSLVVSEALKYNGVRFPDSALACGWLLAAVCLGLVPAFALHAILTRKGETFIEKLKLSFKPTIDWGPMELKDRIHWEKFKGERALLHAQNPSNFGLRIKKFYKFVTRVK